VLGRIGYVRGEIQHLCHGDRDDRQYADRMHNFITFDFDPDRDLVQDANGLVAWSGTNPTFAAGVRDWFEARREDNPAAAPRNDHCQLAATGYRCKACGGDYSTPGPHKCSKAAP
jgi:hypothetical protein